MDWVSATYNRLEILAMDADRVLSSLVERLEDRMAGRRVRTRPADNARPDGKKTRSGQPISA